MPTTTFDASVVSWNRDRFHKAVRSRGSVEASTLFRGKGIPVQFELRNPSTGTTQVFHHVETVRNREGETTHWIFSSKEGTLLLTVWND